MFHICTYELWYNALGNDPDLRKPNINLDLKPLKQLMGLFDEWERSGDRVYYDIYCDDWIDYVDADMKCVTHWMPLPELPKEEA